MIGSEELNNEEEEALKVTDKRKFNVDGSLREGVTIEKEEPVRAAEPSSAAAAEPKIVGTESFGADVLGSKTAQAEPEPKSEPEPNRRRDNE